MNEIKMEDEPLQEPKENANVQIEKKQKSRKMMKRK